LAHSAYTKTCAYAASEHCSVPRSVAASVAVADSPHAPSGQPNTAPTQQACALSVTDAALLFVPLFALLVNVAAHGERFLFSAG